jgi:5'-deoxynucleotidase YfbR-like HD superfamily hydrolase
VIDTTWMQTFTGRKVFPLNLLPEDVCLADIAHALSMQCRFSGHVREFYSVAQHSVLVSVYCDPAYALLGLLHDASEAYLMDLPRPLKHSPFFAFYREQEAAAMAAILNHFDPFCMWPPHLQPSIKEADDRMLATEARDLMAPLHPEWRSLKAPYTRRVVSWSPEEAEIAFLRRFKVITENPAQAHADSMAYRMEAA